MYVPTVLDILEPVLYIVYYSTVVYTTSSTDSVNESTYKCGVH